MDSKASKTKIDICIPTLNSDKVVGETLDHLEKSISRSECQANRILVADSSSNDLTKYVVKNKAEQYGWRYEVLETSCNLPGARSKLFKRVTTKWFLFLDDDVRVSTNYISSLRNTRAPIVGAIQGKKKSREEKPWEWLYRRVYRGGTHATLIRSSLVSELNIPSELEVLEDEFIRRHIMKKGYLWIFNHQATFLHENQKRHPTGYKQGKIAGMFRLMPFHSVVLFLIDALSKPKKILGRTALLIGWVIGIIESGTVRSER